jgi:regulatory protein YycI of two-component signal transduction system YycFG
MYIIHRVVDLKQQVNDFSLNNNDDQLCSNLVRANEYKCYDFSMIITMTNCREAQKYMVIQRIKDIKIIRVCFLVLYVL